MTPLSPPVNAPARALFREPGAAGIAVENQFARRDIEDVADAESHIGRRLDGFAAHERAVLAQSDGCQFGKRVGCRDRHRPVGDHHAIPRRRHDGGIPLSRGRVGAVPAQPHMRLRLNTRGTNQKRNQPCSHAHFLFVLSVTDIVETA